MSFSPQEKQRKNKKNETITKNDIYDDLYKIKLEKNSKIPIKYVSWKDQINHHKIIDTENFNVGIPTGKINNLCVLDIDVKDEGLDEFQLYINEYGEPKTVKQQTPSGGYHLLFLNTHSNPKYKYLIDNNLTNSSKYRNKGIDIRNNGGYIVAAPSKINNIEYKFIRNFNECKILEMPETLIDWLLIGKQNKLIECKTKTKGTPENIKSSLNYLINDDEIKTLLYKLPKKYYKNYNEWLYILTIFKNLNKFDIFDEWSKQSKTYNYNNNVQLWNSNTGNIDINFLVYLVNIENNSNNSSIQYIKPYEPILNDISHIKTITYNNKYVYDETFNKKQFDKDIFNNYSTIIIKSTTGTGKTTSVANHCQNMNYKLISIIARISLANQHKDSFKKKDINLMSYNINDNDKDLDIKNDDIVICINSLLKLKNLSIDDIKKTVLYIDEINSFLESLTNNETLNKKLKQINILLMRLIKYSHKVIVSDALISDGVFELLKNRDDTKKIYIINEYKKFNNVEAYRIKDEKILFDIVKQHILNNEPFLFPSDSCKTISEIYLDCLKYSPEEFKKKLMLITAETKIKVNDATEDFKDKFVFYSPSITYGVDFQPETPQDVFIYIKGHSILPSGFFQQITRTRNIKRLYYYYDIKIDDNNKDDTHLYNINKPLYNNLEEVKEKYRNIINISDDQLYNICINTDINYDEQLIENTFFNLFCYNKYVDDIYNTNKLKHFEQILLNNGFELYEYGNNRQLEKKEKDKLKELKNEYDENLFDEFLNTPNEERTKNDKFNNIVQHITAFKLEDKTNDELLILKECIMNKFYLTEILNYNRLLKNENYIISKINELDKENYTIKNYNSPYHKIFIINNICKLYNLNVFELEYKNENVEFSKELIKYYNVVFNANKKEPKNNNELIKLLVDSYKNLIPTLEIINTESTKPRGKDGKQRRIYKYKLNDNIMKKCNEIINIYGFIKNNETNSNIIKTCNINFIDNEDNIEEPHKETKTKKETLKKVEISKEEKQKIEDEIINKIKESIKRDEEYLKNRTHPSQFQDHNKPKFMKPIY